MPVFAGWERFAAYGGVVMVAPDRARRIRIVERAPVVTLRALVDRLLGQAPPGMAASLTQPPRPVATADGEYAAFFEIVTSGGGAAIQRNVGVVFGEDHFGVIDGHVEQAALSDGFRALIHDLTVAHSLGLGAARWRRYFYRPPAGWRPFARARADVWFHPGYPLAPGTITVFHARPDIDTPSRLQHEELYERLAVAELRPAQPITTSALEGTMRFGERIVEGVRRLSADLLLHGEGSAYPLRLETDAEHETRDLEAFRGLYGSILPLPRVRAFAAPVGHWLE